MALIKCPECGKEISDKADVCPNCGFRVGEQNDLVYVCPKCFSTRLDTVNKKYSAGKGTAGYLLVGEIGLLYGAAGLNNLELCCKECGYKFKASRTIKVKLKDVENTAKTVKQVLHQEGTVGLAKYLQENNIVEGAFQPTRVAMEIESHQPKSNRTAYAVPVDKDGYRTITNKELYSSRKDTYTAIAIVATGLAIYGLYRLICLI